jgi:glycogen debranching enzyme
LPDRSPRRKLGAPAEPVGEVGFDINDSVVIKDENCFLVTDSAGLVPPGGEHPLGLYYNDCRFLSGHRITLLGHQPHPLVCSAGGGNSVVHELTNTELHLNGRRLPGQSLQIRVERTVHGGRIMDEQITIRSYLPEPLETDLLIELGTGFEPMMWIRGIAPDFRPKRPTCSRTRSGLVMRVTGRDGIERSTRVTAAPAPRPGKGTELRWRLKLARGRPQSIALRYVLSDGEKPPRGSAAPGKRPHTRRPVRHEHTRVVTDDELFNRIVERSLHDLEMLRSRLHGQRYYGAGIPWYATLFGRDSLISATQMLPYNQRIAQDTLRVLGQRLGREICDARDEEPGKVLHEIRVGELANLGLMPFARYYGSVDSTPLFLCLLAEHTDWSGDLALFYELAHEVDAALEWIDRYGDLDGDGLLEYRRRAPGGLRNQGWKDSDDGVCDEHGRPLEPPVALVEAQGYAMRAKRRLARVFEAAGQEHRAAALREQAIEMRARIDRFWLARRGYYSMGLDGGKRASRALASNQGHLLWALAVPPDRARPMRDALMSERMFSGWGIRTLAEGEPGFNPVGYHTGSVWPHDSALIAAGLRKYGFDEDFTAIFQGLIEAASRFPDYRLPELFGGFSSERYDIPVPYPVACHPQAWAAGAIPYLLTSGLGLIADGLHRRLRVVRPSLPQWLARVEVRDLEIAGSRVNLRFDRAGDAVTLSDVDIDGDLEVVLEIARNRDPGLGL